MQLIHDHIHNVDPALPRVPLIVDRLTLSKRRWRGVANDGQEFGFDLEFPLADGDYFIATERAAYLVQQSEETVLEVPLSADSSAAARLGWIIGNLHFPLQVIDSVVRVADDPALRQLFEREQLRYVVAQRIFRPLSGGHSHGHHHH
jgi:urease accessory protein